METTLKLAIETYSKLSGLNEVKIIEMIKDGDKVVTSSVMMLMEGVAQ